MALRHAARSVLMTMSRKDRRRKDEWNCRKKIRYETWDDAEAKVLEHLDDLRTPNPPLPYVCPICEGYHLGRRPPLRHSPGVRQGY